MDIQRRGVQLIDELLQLPTFVASILLLLESPTSSARPSLPAANLARSQIIHHKTDWIEHKAESSTEIAINRQPTFAIVPPSEPSLIANQPTRYLAAVEITL